MRSLSISLAAIITAAVAVPSTALAASGWKLATKTDQASGLKTTSRATHCGKSTFGTWKFRNTMQAEGQVAYVSFNVKITKDGKLHKAADIRVTGTAPEDAKTSIAQTIGRENIRYGRQSRKLESVNSQGKLIDTRSFRPTRTTRC